MLLDLNIEKRAKGKVKAKKYKYKSKPFDHVNDS